MCGIAIVRPAPEPGDAGDSASELHPQPLFYFYFDVGSAFVPEASLDLILLLASVDLQFSCLRALCFPPVAGISGLHHPAQHTFSFT